MGGSRLRELLTVLERTLIESGNQFKFSVIKTFKVVSFKTDIVQCLCIFPLILVPKGDGHFS